MLAFLPQSENVPIFKMLLMIMMMILPEDSVVCLKYMVEKTRWANALIWIKNRKKQCGHGEHDRSKMPAFLPQNEWDGHAPAWYMMMIMMMLLPPENSFVPWQYIITTNTKKEKHGMDKMIMMDASISATPDSISLPKKKKKKRKKEKKRRKKNIAWTRWSQWMPAFLWQNAHNKHVPTS